MSLSLFFTDKQKKLHNLFLMKKAILNNYLHNFFYENKIVRCADCGKESRGVGLKKPFLGVYYLASIIIPYGLLINIVFLPLSLGALLKYGVIYYFVVEEFPIFLNKCIQRGKN